MARLLAVEWDAREARVAMANTHGSDVTVELAFTIDLASEGSDESPDETNLGQKLGEALAQRGLKEADTLVGLGRASIELRLMTLPPTPSDERPDLVRFQALQAFTAIGEDWPLDFVEIDSTEESISLLAAVVSPGLVAHVQQACAASDLTPARLLLRPFAAASLLRRGQMLDAHENCLIVDLLADEADLTVSSRGQVVFMRTVRLPVQDDPAVRARMLVGELRRTIGAAQNQLGGRRIEQLIICGDEDEHDVLSRNVSESLSLDVVTFNPFEAVRVGRALRNQLPAHPGRFTPLLGMLADEAAGAEHAIDFLHPRRRPEAASNMRRNLLIAGAGAAMMLLVVTLVWARLRHLDHEIADLQTQSSTLEKEVKAARVLVSKRDAVRKFTDGDITWLDELREMARHLPSADQAILNEVAIGAHPKRGGVMVLKGHVTESSLIAEFEDSLRYHDNIVAGSQGTIDPVQKDYPWLLDTRITVEPDKQDMGRSLGRPFRAAIRKQRLAEKQQADTEQKKPPTESGKKPDESAPPAEGETT